MCQIHSSHSTSRSSSQRFLGVNPIHSQTICLGARTRSHEFEALERTFNLAAPLIHVDPEASINGIKLRDYYLHHFYNALTPGHPNSLLKREFGQPLVKIQPRHLIGSPAPPYPGAENLDQVGHTIWYNGIPTIKAKSRFVRENGLGGLMIWSLENDAKGKASLLSAMSDVLSGNE